SITEIAIAAPDRPRLFSLLAGAITRSRGSIMEAKIFTTADGYALDVFSVQDATGGPFGDGARIERLRRNVIAALNGEHSSRSDTRRSPPANVFQVLPTVMVNNAAS